MYATRFLHTLLGLLCLSVTANAQISAPSPQSATIVAAGTTRPRALADHIGDTIHAVNFGACTWDGAHDVAPCIQSAIYAAVARGGGDVILPVGNYQLAITLTITNDLVRLVSAGGSDGLTWDDLSHQGTYPTVLTWTGSSGAPMITVAPPATTTAKLVDPVGFGGFETIGETASQWTASPGFSPAGISIVKDGNYFNGTHEGAITTSNASTWQYIGLQNIGIQTGATITVSARVWANTNLDKIGISYGSHGNVIATTAPTQIYSFTSSDISTGTYVPVQFTFVATSSNIDIDIGFLNPETSSPILIDAVSISDATSGQPLRGNGIRGILFNANSTAGYGAKLLSVRAGEFRFGFRDALVAGVLLDTVPLGEANDVQGHLFSIRGTNGNTDGDGIRFQATGNSGAWNGNISLNLFDYATMRVRNGWCFNYTSASPYQSADNNYFRMASCQQVGNTAGAGGGIHFAGGSQQVFGYYSGAQVVQEAGTAGNMFLMLDTGNGTQAPIINGGTPINWIDSNGTSHNPILAGQTVVGDYAGQLAAMQTAGAYSSNATLQVVNASDNQLRLWNNNFTTGWAITTDTPTGNLRFVRLAGSGVISFNGISLLSKSFIKTAGTPYTFSGAGDLLSGSPVGNAFQILGTPFTQSGAGENPNLSIYSAIDSYTNPTTRQMVIDAQGTSGAGAMDLVLRNSTGGAIRFQNAGGAQTGYISNTGTIGGSALAVSGAASAASLVLTPTTPASSSAACTAGQINVDASYLYVCTATNTWKRAALSGW